MSRILWIVCTASYAYRRYQDAEPLGSRYDTTYLPTETATSSPTLIITSRKGRSRTRLLGGLMDKEYISEVRGDTTMADSLLSRTSEALMGLIDPWLFLKLSASFIPSTISHIFHTRPFLSALRIVLFSPSRFREAWFGQFWSVAGPNVRDGAKMRVLPLLDGRTTGGRVVDVSTGPGIGGVVIEIGAGSGLWVDVFSNRHLEWKCGAGERTAGEGEGKEREERENGVASARTEITRVYGIEPNPAHHHALRHAVEDAGLQGIYEIVPVGIEDLSPSSSSRRKKWDGSIEPGSVDCIVSVLCLCSIPDPRQNIHELYELLRPGGRWYVYEHVKVRYSWYMRLYQRFLNIFWPRFIGGCELCRPTEQTLRETGPWAKIDVAQVVEEPWYHCVPHILGVFTK
ncbi:hypothetical protein RRF57_004882 [Xylaria bambusicola]|uniref:Methyltransferase type 11 domain-containing protein n=1 Tax=Xylaria bambusicola TaxID=326684 RepID=A0AAN7Z4Q6_9PEZI